MISLSPSLLLTIALIAATVLGAGIGACVLHLRSSRRFVRALTNERKTSAARSKAFDTILAQERRNGSQSHVAAEQARTRADGLKARHEALARHAQEQARRIAALEAGIVARDARQVKIPEARTPEPAPPTSAVARPPVAGTEDKDLPVLNRRVVGRSARGASAPVVADLDFPALAESEVPREVDALALLDTGDLFTADDD